MAGLALAEGIHARGAEAVAGRARTLEGTAGTRGEGARMTRAPEQTVDQPSPGDDEQTTTTTTATSSSTAARS